MSKFTGSALALLVAFSLIPLAQSEAGDRGDRHRIVKHNTFKLTDRNAHRHNGRHVRRIVNRNVVVVRVDGDGGRHHRRHRQVNTYSGDVVIDVRNGVGQWSYGSYSSAAASVTVSTPALKIIDVGTLKTNSGCDMQAGVCVIRP